MCAAYYSRPPFTALKGRSAYRMHEMVEDLSELLPALGHDKCVLVSHDWGAAIAWSFATRHPVRPPPAAHPPSPQAALRNSSGFGAPAEEDST